MRLNGLPATKGRIIDRARLEGWYSEEQKGLGGTRRVYEIPAKYLAANEPPPHDEVVDLNLIEAQQGKLRQQMAEIGRTTAMNEMELLQEVVRGVELWIAKNNLPHDPDKKAALISLLYSYFKPMGQLDQEKLHELLKAVA